MEPEYDIIDRVAIIKTTPEFGQKTAKAKS